jgi:hypothetical protein
MATLEGKLTPDDVEVLIESMDFWETSGNREFHIMQMFKNMPLPEEDHEAFEPIKEAKQYFAGRERDIKADRSLRKEKATILKAKLMLMRSDMTVDRIFEDASDEPVSVTKTAPVKSEPQKVAKTDQDPKLTKAEQFLDQSGIKGYYDKFLNGKPSTLEQAEQYIEECGMADLWKQFLAK